MRIGIRFQFDGELKLPIHYNHIIQGFIYKNLDPLLAEKLHNYGFPFQKRKFKLFNFSRLFGKFSLAEDNIIFRSPVKFYFATPLEDLITDFATNLIKKEYLSLGQKPVRVLSIEVEKRVEDIVNTTNSYIIQFLSPCTVYRTLSNNNRKYTYYFSPWEEEFRLLIFNNLLKKYQLLYKEKRNDFFLELYPAFIPESKNRFFKIVKFKDTIVKGWLGRFLLKTNPELFLLALDTGLGSKNSQGFGFFKIILLQKDNE